MIHGQKITDIYFLEGDEKESYSVGPPTKSSIAKITTICLDNDTWFEVEFHEGEFQSNGITYNRPPQPKAYINSKFVYKVYTE